jgi:hypothetical protein
MPVDLSIAQSSARLAEKVVTRLSMNKALVEGANGIGGTWNDGGFYRSQPTQWHDILSNGRISLDEEDRG